MAEVNNDIVIRYSLQGIDEVNAAHQKIAQQTKAFNQSQITEAKNTSAQKVKISSDEVTQKVTHLKRYADFEKEYHNKSTAVLRDAVMQHIKLIGDEKTARQEALISGNKAEAAASAERIKIWQLEQNKLRQLLQERPSVLTGGAGAIVGQLGIGRSLSGLGSFVPGMSGVSSALSALGPAGIAAGAGMGAMAFGLKKVIDAGSAAEDKMQQLKAQSGMVGNQLVDTRKKAEELAQKFGDTVPNSIDAFRLTINALGLGITKNQRAMNTMTSDVMTFAKAANVDAATAASALANTFNEMGGSIENPAKAAVQFTSMMNVIAAAAREGNAQIADLIQSFEQIGPLAHEEGMSIEVTSSAIETLAHSNIRGADAGVMLRDVLLGLGGATRTSTKAFEELGLKPEQIDPKVVGLSKSLQMLKERLSQLNGTEQTQVMSHLFGKEAIVAGEVLMNNTKLLDQFTTSVTGTDRASEMAAANMDTFHDQIAKIKATLESGLVEAFYDNRQEIEKMTQDVGHDLPSAIHTATTALTGMLSTLSDLNRTLNSWGETSFNIEHSIDKFFGVENAHEKNVDAQERIDAFNKAHALSPEMQAQLEAQQKIIDDITNNPSAHPEIYGTSVPVPSLVDNSAFSVTKKKGRRGTATDMFGNTHSMANAVTSQWQAYIQRQNEEVKQAWEEGNQIDEQEWEKYKARQKKQEHDIAEQARQTLEINKKLRDDIIGLDKDAEEKKKLQAAAKFEDTKKEIEAEKVDEDTKNKQLIVAKAIYEQELSVAADTVTSKVDKQSDAFTRLTEAIKGTTDVARNWGEIGGALIAVIADKLFPSNTAKQTTGLPDNLKAMLPAGIKGSFKTGTDAVPSDGLYFLHKDEIVIPAPVASTTATPRPSISAPIDPGTAYQVGVQNERDRQTAKYFHVPGGADAVRRSRLSGNLNMLRMFREVAAMPVEQLVGFGLEEGLATSFERLAETKGGQAAFEWLEHVAPNSFNRLTNGLAHAGGHLGGHVSGVAFSQAVFGGEVPAYNDSPLLSQSGAPKIGGKYLVAGAGDDMLVKGGTLPEVLTLAVTKGVDAAKITDNTKKTATATEKINVADFSKAAGTLTQSVYGLAQMTGPGKHPGGADLAQAAGGSIDALGGVANALGASGAASGLGAVGSATQGLSGLAGMNFGKGKNAYHGKATKVIGSMLGSLAPMVSMIPGFGTIAGAGMGLLGGLVGSFDKGTDYVPRTGLAMVHEGEQIKPKGSSNRIHPADIRALASAMSSMPSPVIHPATVRSTYAQGNNAYNTW